MSIPIEVVKLNVISKKSSVVKGDITAIKSINGSLLAMSQTKSSFNIYEGANPSSLNLTHQFEKNIQYPGGILKIGEEYHILDSNKKLIYMLDKSISRPEPQVLLTSIKVNTASAILNACNSSITDMEYHDDKIWFACMAGYSSSICSYDIITGHLNFGFYTIGSRPNGILYNNQRDQFMVLDSKRNSISNYSKDGTLSMVNQGSMQKGNQGVDLKDNRPIVTKGLAIDSDDQLWVMSQKIVRQRVSPVINRQKGV